jgi:hypothetical protein
MQWKSPRSEPLPEREGEAQERERGKNDGGGVHL